jgi:hypothetical protein
MSNILYLEHTQERHGVVASLKQAGAHVDMIEEPTERLLSEKLRTSRYDIVITDAYFLKKDVDHVPGVEDGLYMLDQIVREVRKVDNKRVKIVVLTNFSSALLTNHKDDLDVVDYLWDKASAGSDFIYWQVKRILEEQRKGLPEHKLVNTLLDLLSGQEEIGQQWRERMIRMLESYRSSDLESQQIEDIKSHLIWLANELGFESEFSYIFNKVQAAESMNIAANPLAWGHLRHAINVFWLGYYFLNCGALDLKRIGDRIFGRRSAYDREKAGIAVNASWFLASLLHDIGLLGEKAPDLIERFNDIVKIYPLENAEMENPRGLKEYGKTASGLMTQLLTMLDRDVVEYFDSLRNPKDAAIDHGILSSVTVLKLFGEKEPSRIYGEAAAAAIALHNVMNMGIEEEQSMPVKIPRIDFSNHPLAALLIICDQIEIWDRQTGYENDYSELALESCELSELILNTERAGGAEIALTLNYVPFKSIAPDDTAAKTSKRKILDILSRKVVPSLDRISIADDWHTKFKILFKYNGREDLRSWPGGVVWKQP